MGISALSPRMQQELTGVDQSGADMVPSLDPGFNVLQADNPQSLAIHQLVCETLEATSEAWWVDGVNTVSTYALYQLAPTTQLVEDIQVSRAFTAYQHSSLVSRLVRKVSPSTDVVVLSGFCNHYRSDEVPDEFGARLFKKSLRVLEELVSVTDVTLIVSVTGDDQFAKRVRGAADETITCEQTDLGMRFEGDDFETQVFWKSGYWQTTIPYWVELLGTVDEQELPGVRPSDYQIDLDTVRGI